MFYVQDGGGGTGCRALRARGRISFDKLLAQFTKTVFAPTSVAYAFRVGPLARGRISFDKLLAQFTKTVFAPTPVAYGLDCAQ